MLMEALNLGQWRNNSVIIFKNGVFVPTEAGNDH